MKRADKNRKRIGPMKILCLIDNLSTGGAQRQIINLAVGLRRRGHQVAMFCYASGALLAERLVKEGIPVHLHLKKSRFSLDVILALRRTIDREGFQAVVSFLSTPNFYGVMSSRFSRTRPAAVVSERSFDLPGQSSRLELAVRHFYRLSRRVVVNSHHQRENFLRRYPWMGERVVTIYNGYHLDDFAPALDESQNSRLEILVIASVQKIKNGLCLIRALDILAKEHGLRPGVSWAGERSTAGERGEYLSAMEGEIGRLGLGPQWQWLGQRTDIADLLHRHDVLVHASYGEGLPNAVCEAMACGRPVIVSNAFDHPRLVTDGVNGFLFDCEDPADLAAKIKAFHDLPPAARHRMGERGREFAEKNLSIERYVGDFEKTIAEAVGR